MRLFFLYFIIFNFFSAFGQNSNEYIGAIKLNDSTALTYKIEFEENNGKISGYSVTDFGGEHETKSSIKGTYNDKDNMLSFYETGIVYTKSIFVKNDFCFIHFQPTSFKLGKTKSFKGTFLGKFNDGVECINGEIFLNAIEKIEKLESKLTKKVNNSKKVSDSLKAQYNNVKIMDSINLNILKKDQVTSIFTKSKSVKFYIYDGGKIDNDVITIQKDGKVILFKHQISEKKELIEVPVTANTTRITIIAESTGTIGTTTAIIEVKDDSNDIKTLTSLNKGEKTEIDILKKM